MTAITLFPFNFGVVLAVILVYLAIGALISTLLLDNPEFNPFHGSQQHWPYILLAKIIVVIFWLPLVIVGLFVGIKKVFNRRK